MDIKNQRRRHLIKSLNFYLQMFNKKSKIFTRCLIITQSKTKMQDLHILKSVFSIKSTEKHHIDLEPSQLVQEYLCHS